MHLAAIQTRLMKPSENLKDFLLEHTQIQEGDVIAISTKLFSYAENRILAVADKAQVAHLIEQEAQERYPGKYFDMCLKYGLWVANAGIDDSNSPAETVILWPKDPQASIDQLHRDLKLQSGVQNFGLIMVDTICSPLRKGVTGAGLCVAGFKNIISKIGKPDLYGRPLAYTTIGVADSLAACANLLMGEADEKTGIVKITNCDLIEFTSKYYDSIKSASMDKNDCVFEPIFKF